MKKLMVLILSICIGVGVMGANVDTAKLLEDGKIMNAKRWTKLGVLDQRMYDHCLEDINNYVYEIEQLNGTVISEKWKVSYDDIYERELKASTKRGIVQVEDLLNNLTGEIEAYAELDYLIKKYPSQENAIYEIYMMAQDYNDMIARMTLHHIDEELDLK